MGSRKHFSNRTVLQWLLRGWWSHRPWRGSRSVGLWHLGMWVWAWRGGVGLGWMTTEASSNRNDSVVREHKDCTLPLHCPHGRRGSDTTEGNPAGKTPPNLFRAADRDCPDVTDQTSGSSYCLGGFGRCRNIPLKNCSPAVGSAWVKDADLQQCFMPCRGTRPHLTPLPAITAQQMV